MQRRRRTAKFGLLAVALMALYACKRNVPAPAAAVSSQPTSAVPVKAEKQPVNDEYRPTKPDFVGSTSLQVAETGRSINLQLSFFPYNEEEQAESYPSSANQGMFTRLVFQDGERSYELKSKHVLIRLTPLKKDEPGDGDPPLEGMEIHRSHFFRTATYSDTEGPHTLLFFRGPSGASDADHSLIVGFSSDGAPYKMIEEATFDIFTFVPPQGKSPARIVGRHEMTESMGYADDKPNSAEATTYDPYEVYLLSSEERPKFVYSLDASKAYNEANYVWAGRKPREDYAVFFNVPGHPKPFGAPASQVDRIFKTNRP